jgi:hypothetical protein
MPRITRIIAVYRALSELSVPSVVHDFLPFRHIARWRFFYFDVHYLLRVRHQIRQRTGRANFSLLRAIMKKNDNDRRVIMRVELAADARDNLPAIVDKFGSTNVAVNSRLVEWFCDQPESVQAAILGLHPVDVKSQLPVMILQNMAGK